LRGVLLAGRAGETAAKSWAAFYKQARRCAAAQPSSWSGYNASIDNVPDRRIDIGIPRQRVFAR
jgi:energy-converting hydrogenase Eha subunit G